jgi:hypothetical protein
MEEPEVKQENKPKLVGRLRPQKGHIVYEYNTETGKLVPATYDKQEKGQKNKKITITKGCIYVSALNIKNAVRRLGKYHGVNVEIQ